MPNSFSECPDGNLLVADGYGFVLRWDTFGNQATPAGVPAPTTGPAFSGSGIGGIVGRYKAFVRFLDSRGNPGNPVSNGVEVDIASASAAVEDVTNTVPIVVKATGHGLTTGIVVKLEGVQGNTGANNTWTVTVVDASHFSLDGSAGSGTWVTGTGTYSAGASLITYTAVPTSTDPRVVRRQILRNTDGQLATFYIDVDTTDLSSTTLTSTLDDDTLSTHASLSLEDSAGRDSMNVYYEPPQDKPYLAFHQGRMFAGGDAEYSEGAAVVTNGSTAVEGVATEWMSALVGRYFYVADAGTVSATKAFYISAVDEANQTLTLSEPFDGTTDAYASYSIRVHPEERRQIAYSLVESAEAWSPLRAVAVPEDGDEVTGFLRLNSFLFILERRHVYKLTFQDDPSPQGDGALFLSTTKRGCINHRSWCLADGAALMLDERGIWRFDGGEATTLSTPIQSLFRSPNRGGPGPRINWSASRFFHCVLDPGAEVARWFVSLSGQYLPRHAICYQYSLNRWWLEEYPVPVGSAAVGRPRRIAGLETWGTGRETVFLGVTGRRIVALGSGGLDGPDPNAGPARLKVASATQNTLTVKGLLNSTQPGWPVVVESGRGKGQRRVVTAVSGSQATLKTPWAIKPDASSTVVFGGVPWEYKTGWFRFADGEELQKRSWEVHTQPSQSEKVTVKRYRDRSETPVAPVAAQSGDGVQVDGDGLLCDLGRSSGFVKGRFDGGKEWDAHGPRLLALGLSGTGGPNPVEVFQITLEGVK